MFAKFFPLIFTVVWLPGHLFAKELYPDVSRCFKGISQNETGGLEKRHKLCTDHLSIENSSENSFCFKFCVLVNSGVIDRLEHQSKNIDQLENEGLDGYNFKFEPEVAAEILYVFHRGLQEDDGMDDYTDRDEPTQTAIDSLQKRMEKCAEFGFWIPKELKCQNYSSTQQAKLETLLNCFQEAIDC